MSNSISEANAEASTSDLRREERRKNRQSTAGLDKDDRRQSNRRAIVSKPERDMLLEYDEPNVQTSLEGLIISAIESKVRLINEARAEWFLNKTEDRETIFLNRVRDILMGME